MSAPRFVEEIGTERLFERVSRYCGECYREFLPGERIYYDLEQYRYLCRECAEKCHPSARSQEGEEEGAVREKSGSLF